MMRAATLWAASGAGERVYGEIAEVILGRERLKIAACRRNEVDPRRLPGMRMPGAQF